MADLLWTQTTYRERYTRSDHTISTDDGEEMLEHAAQARAVPSL
jgi:hypothetical protein